VDDAVAAGERFNPAAILLHWVTAVAVCGLFGLGLYMVGLDYYDPWYNRGPHLHQSFGLLLAVLMVCRLALRALVPPPPPLPGVGPLERRLARAAHALLNALTIATLLTGYGISSAGGESVALFDWLQVPAVGPGFDGQEDVAGRWHERLAWALMLLAALHAAAAFKHHCLDRDRTLLRMLGR
jgi:cytochrome b561